MGNVVSRISIHQLRIVSNAASEKKKIQRNLSDLVSVLLEVWSVWFIQICNVEATIASYNTLSMIKVWGFGSRPGRMRFVFRKASFLLSGFPSLFTFMTIRPRQFSALSIKPQKKKKKKAKTLEYIKIVSRFCTISRERNKVGNCTYVQVLYLCTILYLDYL